MKQLIIIWLSLVAAAFEQEIMSIEELAQKLNFEHIHSTGHVRYDVEKLRWLNQKWIAKLAPQDLMERCLPFLLKTYPQAENLNRDTLAGTYPSN